MKNVLVQTIKDATQLQKELAWGWKIVDSKRTEEGVVYTIVMDAQRNERLNDL